MIMTLLISGLSVSQTAITNCFSEKAIIGIDRDLRKLDNYDNIIIPEFNKSIREFKAVIASKDTIIKKLDAKVDTLILQVVETNNLMKHNKKTSDYLLASEKYKFDILKKDHTSQAELIADFPKMLNDAHKKGKWKGFRNGFLVGVAATILGVILIN